jgi:hypothetical protein
MQYDKSVMIDYIIYHVDSIETDANGVKIATAYRKTGPNKKTYITDTNLQAKIAKVAIENAPDK